MPALNVDQTLSPQLPLYLYPHILQPVFTCAWATFAQVFNVAATIMESGADIISLQGIVVGPAGQQALAMLLSVLNLFDAGKCGGRMRCIALSS